MIWAHGENSKISKLFDISHTLYKLKHEQLTEFAIVTV